MKYLLISMLFIATLQATHLHKEVYYQKAFCKKINGITEYILVDRTRVDCLTATHAIEVEFASKWAESIGQSLHYSLMTNKKAGVYLIIESEKDLKYLRRLENVGALHDIKIWSSYYE